MSVYMHSWSQVQLLQVEQLLDSGVNVNASDAYGETALHLACMEGQYTVVRMLVVEQQARMDVKNWEGWVPMIWAIVRGHDEIVKFLAERVCSQHGALLEGLISSGSLRMPPNLS